MEFYFSLPYFLPAKFTYQSLRIYTDGGARGNPGISGAGIVIADEKDEIFIEKDIFLGICTNNRAEYLALLFALQEVSDRCDNPKKITAFSDSELLVKQLNGEYKIKNAELKKLFDEIQNLKKKFQNIAFVHIPRSKNKRADALANKAMDRGY